MKATGNLVPIDDLRPTQMSVGFEEVARKRREWSAASGPERGKMLRQHVVPAVTGPKGRFYVVDHHHFVKSLLEEGEAALPVFVMAELHHLPKDEFWTVLDNRSWCHAYDGKGARKALNGIPKRFEDLEDDPFRSLASQLLRTGAIAKSDTPFFEFLWADYLRRRMSAEAVQKGGESANAEAFALAKDPAAKELPGWCGAKG